MAPPESDAGSDVALNPFVPAPVARMAQALGLDAPAPAFLSGDGVVLFCDISGFTALTERLAHEGLDGAEVLSRILESVFERIVSAIAANGGEVVAFPGDAVIAVWNDPRPIDALGRAAAAAALTIQASLATRMPLQGESLTLRVGIERGPITHLLVGNAGFFAYLLSGPPLAALGRLTEKVSPNSVALGPRISEIFDRAEISQRVGEPHVRLEKLLRHADAATEPMPLLPGAFAASFVPRVVRNRLAASQSIWLAEFRRVSVLFVGLSGLTLDRVAGLEDAQRVVGVLLAEIDRHQGSLLQLVVDERGPTALAVWGLPGESHDNDAELALRAALNIRTSLARSGQNAACGVATGRAFCGLRGAQVRREYAVFGAVVNRAARLMAKARPEGVVCDRASADRAAARLAFDVLGEVALKGIDEPVTLLRPRETDVGTNDGSSRVQHFGRLVGRDFELNQLTDRLYAVIGGDAGVAVIEGEPGIGKSHLISAFREIAARAPVHLVNNAADAVEQSTPYYAWRAVFAQLFAAYSVPELEQRLGSSARWLPLAGSVLPHDIEDTPLTRQLEGEARASRSVEVLSALLQTVAAQRPLVLVIDDAQWLDTLSWRLSLQVAELPHCFLLLSLRTPDEPGPIALSRIVGKAGCLRLPLAPLTAADCVAMLVERFRVHELPAEVGAFVQERANGNPLFSEQIALAMLDSGAIRITDDVCTIVHGGLATLDVPDTVEGVITSRIDGLTTEAQLTAKVASTIGRGFDYGTLAAVHPIQSTVDLLAPHLRVLTTSNFVSVEAPEPLLSYLFTHLIVKEVLYGLLSFHQRQRLHCAIAEHLERRYADDLEPHWPLLAHHWQQGRNSIKAVYYLERAGKQALDQFANPEAIRFLSAAVATDNDALPSVTHWQRSRWQWWLGIAHLKLSDYDQCSTHQVRGLRYLGWPVPGTRVGLATSLLAQIGVQMLHRMLPTSALLANDMLVDRFKQASEMYRYRAEYGYFNTDVVWAVQAMLKCLNFAERGGDRTQTAGAYAALGVVAGIGGQHRIARYYSDRALSVAESSGDKSTLAFVHQLIAVYRHSLGSWNTVGRHAAESVALFAEVGDQFRWEGCLSIQIMLHLHRCELDALDRVAEQMYRSAHPNSAAQMRCYVYGGRLASAILRGRVDRTLLDETQGVLAATLAHGEQIFCHGLLAWGYAAIGDDTAARASSERALDVATAHPPGTYYNKFPLDGAAEVARRQWAHALEHGRDAAIPATLVRRARQVLKRFAALSPVSGALRWLYEGNVATVMGQHRRAARCFRKSLALADRFDLDFDRFRALDALSNAAAVPAPRQLGYRLLARDLSKALDLSEALQTLEPDPNTEQNDDHATAHRTGRELLRSASDLSNAPRVYVHKRLALGRTRLRRSHCGVALGAQQSRPRQATSSRSCSADGGTRRRTSGVRDSSTRRVRARHDGVAVCGDDARSVWFPRGQDGTRRH